MRSIDWFQHSVISIRSRIPELGDSTPYVTERLAALLLDRLPRRLSNRMLGLLPSEVAASHRLLRRPASSVGDSSIGYPAFVEVAQEAVGVSETHINPGEMGEEEALTFYRMVADAFLWAVTQELPPDLKSLVERDISADLRARMNLYSASAEESKVA
jgi:hypothetical protein